MVTENTTAPAADNAARASQTPADAPTAADAATVTGGRPDGASGPVWDALTATPGASVTAIAAAAGVPKAAARRALIELETGGHATRTTGGWDGGKRAADEWHPTPTDTDPATADTDTDTGGAGEDDAAPVTDEPTGDATTAGADTTTPTNPAPDISPDTSPDTVPDTVPDTSADTATTPPAPADTDHDQADMNAAAVTEARQALTALGEVIIAAVDALTTGDREAASTAAEVIYADSGRTRRLVRAAANVRPRTSSGRARSHPGEMRAKVAAHLAAHPGKEFTPHEIGKVIGHSAGAVANALDRLATLGQAVETCERPRRFTAEADHNTDTDEAAGVATPTPA
jgi:hypothetical protein